MASMGAVIWQTHWTLQSDRNSHQVNHNMYPRALQITALDTTTWQPMNRLTHLPNPDQSLTNLIQLRLLPRPSFLIRTLNRQVQTIIGGQNLNEWCRTRFLTPIGAHEAGLVAGVAVPVKVFRWRVTTWELLSGRKSVGLVHKLHQMATILVIHLVRGGEALSGEPLAIALPSPLHRYRTYRTCMWLTIMHIPRKLERNL